MPRHEQTAVVVVEKDWYDRALRIVIGKPRSTSTVDVHLLTGPIKNAADPIGLVLKGIRSRPAEDGSEVMMEFLIPWRYVLGFGLVDEPNPRIGFPAEGVGVTDLTK